MSWPSTIDSGRSASTLRIARLRAWAIVTFSGAAGLGQPAEGLRAAGAKRSRLHARGIRARDGDRHLDARLDERAELGIDGVDSARARRGPRATCLNAGQGVLAANSSASPGRR